jgi:tetratricopeptide (TPR) repeat protein
MRSKTLACLILLAATSCVYSQVSGHAFLVYDDPAYVTGNANVKAGWTADSVRWAFTSIHSGNWHPLTSLSHLLDVQLFGMEPRWHHLMNVFLHLANILLLFVLFDRMTASPWRSLFVAALFALHPLHVESVAWVSERKDVLSTLFFLLTLIFHCRYAERQTRSRYLLTLTAFILGLMSKPMLVTLPFVLLLMDHWPLGRTGFPRPDAPTCKRLIVEKLPFFALSAASCVVTVYAQWDAAANLERVPLLFRFVNALMAYVYYLGKMLWPYRLAAIYPLPPAWTILQGVEAFLLLAGITAFSVLTVSRHPYLLVGWLWYLGTLVPVIGLVQVGRQFIADRYTYIPLIGIFIMIAWGVPNLIRNTRYRRIALSSAAGLILLASSAGSWIQLGYWKDSITLFGHATGMFPDNYIARNILGNALSDAGRIEEAVSQFSQVLRVWPEDVEALTGIGTVLAKQGRNEEAARYFNEVLRLYPESADGHFQIGLLFAERGELDECIYHFNKVLRIRPDDVETHHNLGVALVKQGKLDDAISHFREALRVQPDLVQAAVSLEAAYRLKNGSNGR